MQKEVCIYARIYSFMKQQLVFNEPAKQIIIYSTQELYEHVNPARPIIMLQLVFDDLFKHK